MSYRLSINAFVVAFVVAACMPSMEGVSGPEGGDPCAPVTSTTSLVAGRAVAAPTVDGMAEDSWSCRPFLEVDVRVNAGYQPEGSPIAPSYPGLETSRVHMRAQYDDTHLYLLATWDDPTYSLARWPWEKQLDGTWVQLMNKDSSGHENTYYEDKISLQWNVDAPAFSVQGCYASCHTATDNAHPGKKYNTEGVTDLWHWKSARTGPNRQLDDGYVGFPESGLCEELNCRIHDSDSTGGYLENTFAGIGAGCVTDPDGMLGLPCFMGPTGREGVVGDAYWVFDGEKQPFMDAFLPGDLVAGIVTRPFEGGRADVTTVGTYQNGVWSVEMSRPLTTNQPLEDVQFSDLAAVYDFGVSIFDNTQINHAVHAGVLQLSFEP